MDIAMAFDANYAHTAQIAIESILLSRAVNDQVTFWLLLDEDVPEDVHRQLRRQLDSRALLHLSIRSALDELPSASPEISHVSHAMYLRFLFPDIVPHGVERLLYLDCDVLCLGSLEPLFEVDLGLNILGAVRDKDTRRMNDRGGIPGLLTYPQLDPWAPYFNSGVLLIDVEGWRRGNVTETCMSYVERHREEARYPDQDALNYAVYDRWLRIPNIWNYMMTWRLESAVGGKLSDARICHLAGNLKAWEDSFPEGDVKDHYRRCAESCAQFVEA